MQVRFVPLLAFFPPRPQAMTDMSALSVCLTSSPTPLDCLIISHLFIALTTLDPTNPLRRAIEADKVLRDYADRLIKRLDATRTKKETKKTM